MAVDSKMVTRKHSTAPERLFYRTRKLTPLALTQKPYIKYLHLARRELQSILQYLDGPIFSREQFHDKSYPVVTRGLFDDFIM